MKIGGHCNQCGACCWLGAYKCVNLIPAENGRSACAVYGDREPGMPVTFIREDGAWFQGICAHTQPIEVVILSQLIEQGICSMEVIDDG